MNLLFYFDHPILPHAGGTERAAYLLAEALSRHGHRVSFLSLRRADSLPAAAPYFYLPRTDTLSCAENREYVETLCAGQGTDCIINCGANQDDSFFFSHERLSVQASIVSWISFDVRTGLDYFPALLRKDFSTWGQAVKTLLRRAILPYRKHQAVSGKRKKYRDMFRGSDKVIFLSSRYRDDALQLAGTPERARLYSIPNLLTYEPAESAPSQKENAVLYVGRLVDSPKKADRLLKVWKNVHPRHPDWHLYLVGDGPERGALERLAARLKLENVHFEGVQDPAPYYRKARILCLTSTHEGMPMVINEALSHGCTPVVFNSFRAAEEMLPDRETGRLVPPFSLRLFARELDELMSGSHVPPRTDVLTNYQPEKVIPLWLECLQEQP